jgi:hypothetical protein
VAGKWQVSARAMSRDLKCLGATVHYLTCYRPITTARHGVFSLKCLAARCQWHLCNHTSYDSCHISVSFIRQFPRRQFPHNFYLERPVILSLSPIRIRDTIPINSGYFSASKGVPLLALKILGTEWPACAPSLPFTQANPSPSPNASPFHLF